MTPSRDSSPHQMKSVVVVCLLAGMLAGCAVERHLPSQSSPTCSWASNVPANHDMLCRLTFSTLSAIVQAEVRQDEATIHRLVPNPVVARRIIAHAAGLHAVGAQGLHVVPSMTLDFVSNSRLGVGFFILGKSRQGRIKAPQAVYLRIRGKAEVITGDQANQEW